MLLCSLSHAGVGDAVVINSSSPYYQEGVVITSINATASYVTVDKQASTRFYDSNKGGEWTTPYSDGTSGDSLMCWSHAASNSIQFWQTYYGVFYTGERELPYGNIGTEPAYYGATETIPNTKQLSVAKAFYENWPDSGGKFGPATDWFFKWDDSSSNGGYYSNYFGNASSSRPSYVTIYSQGGEALNASETNTSAGYTPFADTRAGLTETLLPAFGLTRNADSTYTQTEVGLLPFLGIWYDDTSTGQTLSYGHMISCYGFTLDENGDIKTILVSNSDDGVSQLQQLFVKEQNGQLRLYRNEAGTQKFTGRNWYIGEVSYISTPDSLKAMYADYANPDNELLWKGGENASWQAENQPTAPGEGNWGIHADAVEGYEGIYNSNAVDGRNVRFDAKGYGGNVLINGVVSPGDIEIAEESYRFVAGEDAEIQGSGDIVIRSGAALQSEVLLGERTIKIESKAGFSYERSADTEVGSLTAAQDSTLQFRNSSTESVVTYNTGSLQGIAGSLILGAADDLYGTSLWGSGNMQVQNLILNGSSTMSTDGVVKVLGQLQSLQSMRSAATFSLRDAAQSPTIDADLDLSQAKEYTPEQAISLNGHSLILSGTNAITLTLPYVLADHEQFLLFEDISKLYIDGTAISQSRSFAAADFFTGAAITPHMQLLYTQSATTGFGSLVLVNAIPEPTTGTLAVLSLSAFAARRRRK